MSPRSAVAIAVLACVAAASLERIGPFTISSTLHAQEDRALPRIRIDAIAVDRRGAVVRTLAPSDFEVQEGETAVTLDEARFVEDDARAIGIYLDEYHITAGPNADRARDALLQVVERDLGPNDVVIVMKPLDSLFTLQPAASLADVRSAVATLQGRKGDLAPQTDYERTYMSGTSDRIEAARAQVAVSALNALAVRLSSLNDRRKTLLVVTEGLDPSPTRRGQEFLATVDSVTRSANRGHVSIYPIDPQPIEGRTAASPVLGLADATRGQIVTTTSTGDLTAPIRAALADASKYYLLTYRRALDESGRFHPVQVKVKQPGVQVRARAGYWAPSVSDRLGAELVALANRPAPPVRVEPMRRNSPLIRPWFGLSLTDAGRMRVTFVWEPTPGMPGAATSLTAARLELTVLGDNDKIVFQGPVLPTGPVVTKGAEPSSAVFETEPGRLKLRMKIEDATRRQIDSDVRDLEVRDVRGKVTIGTPEFLRARNALELRALHNNPDAVPVSSREFSRSERLLIRFPAYAPGGAEVSLSARLLNFAGQPMRTLNVQVGRGDQREIEVSLAGLASGEYLLELAATSSAGQITERVSFRVTT
ncbi:MAG TPA: VWA domain-containing protein [Vicinamibacterales bacterium]|nr:VWA domain-containing protein [Vicinamibacterales bacterium]